MRAAQGSFRVKGSITVMAAMVMIASMSLLAGCCLKGPCPVPDLRLPSASDIQHVEVIRWRPNGDFESSFRISDRRRIEEILAQLQSVNSDFANVMDRQAPQEVSLAFEGRKGLKALVWIGPGWLAGVDSRHRSMDGELWVRHRQIEPGDHEKIAALLTR